MNAALNPLLLKALAASGTRDGVSPQEVLLSQLGEEDPTVAMLAEYLTRSSDGDDDDDDDPLADSVEEIRAELERDYEEQTRTLAAYEAKLHSVSAITSQLRNKLNAIYSELQGLQERNDLLAKALGACHRCWGEDLDCDVCRGEGYPGFFRPDPDMFRQYAVPAVTKMQGQKSDRQQSDYGA